MLSAEIMRELSTQIDTLLPGDASPEDRALLAWLTELFAAVVLSNNEVTEAVRDLKLEIQAGITTM